MAKKSAKENRRVRPICSARTPSSARSMPQKTHAAKPPLPSAEQGLHGARHRGVEEIEQDCAAAPACISAARRKKRLLISSPDK